MSATDTWPSFSGYEQMCRALVTDQLSRLAEPYNQCRASNSCPLHVGTTAMRSKRTAAPRMISAAASAVITALAPATIGWRGDVAVLQ